MTFLFGLVRSIRLLGSAPIRRVSAAIIFGVLVAPSFAQEADGQVESPKAANASDDEPDPRTVTPLGDPRWDLMGEFSGDVTLDGRTQRYGLQLRPLGETDFQGQLYQGGLPGEEGFDKKGTRVIGLHSDEFVVISGGPGAIIGRPESCLVLDSKGTQIGELVRTWRVSPTLGAPAPENAIVLFDGTNTDQFLKAKVTSDGLLKNGADVLPMVQDFNMHVEYLLPFQPERDGQDRGNSGCYLLSRYEVQVLDSFATKPVFNGCGSLYRTREPDLNMCYPPLRWQTYDIIFTSPRWLSNGEKRRNAHITVIHNGVKIHDNVELKNKTGAGKIEAPTLLPIKFQDHREPVRYRNIWMVDRGLDVGGEFPRYPEPGAEVSTDPPQRNETPPPAVESTVEDTAVGDA